jgi:hypothetical protein
VIPSDSTPLKLPKQWKHWVSSAGLRPRANTGTTRGLKSAWFYLHGHGREWRVNDRHELQCGDTYADFDRWALCEIQQAPMPTTRAEFVATVRKLLALHATPSA